MNHTEFELREFYSLTARAFAARERSATTLLEDDESNPHRMISAMRDAEKAETLAQTVIGK